MNAELLFREWFEDLILATFGTQEAFAQHINVGQTTVSAWVRGVSPPSKRNAYKAAKALGVSYIEFLERAGLEVSTRDRKWHEQLEEERQAAGYEPEGTDARSISHEEVRRMVLEFKPLADQLQALVSQFEVREVEVVEPVYIPILGYVPADTLRWATADDLGRLEVTPGEVEGAIQPYAVIVTGNCLRSLSIVDGDTVILDLPEGRTPRDRQLVAVEIDGEVTLKRWCETDNGIELRDGDDNVVRRLGRNEDIRIQGFYVTFRPTGER